MMELLRTKSLVKLYGDRRAVNDANLSINENETVVVTGASGAGKSTLARLLCGMERPDAGEISILGKELEQLSDTQLAAFRARHIGFLQSEPIMEASMTVAENIALPLMAVGMPYKHRMKRAYELLDSLDMRIIAGACPSSVGAFKKCMACLLRAIAASPKLIIADECTRSLNTKEAAAFMTSLKLLRKNIGGSLIFFTTDAKLQEVVDRAYTIIDGRLQEVTR